MCLTTDYLQAIIDEVKAGNDVGLVIITVDAEDDGSAVEMYSNCSSDDTGQLLKSMASQITTQITVH